MVGKVKKQTMKINYPYRIKNNKRYYYWEYRDVYGNRNEESSPSIEGLENKIEKRRKLLAFGVNVPNISFEDYLLNYLTTVHFNKLKPKSKERYLYVYNKKVKGGSLGSIKMSHLTVEAIQKYYNDLFELSNSNQVKELNKIIRPCLKYAFNTGNILRDISSMIQIPYDSPEIRLKRATGNSVKPLTREEHIAFVNVGIRGHELEALFRTAIDTGARQGELFALTWHDIDFEKKIIVINKSYSYSKGATDTFVGQTGPTKCNEIRRNKLAHVLIEILQQHKHNQKEIFDKFGVIQDENSLVFSTPIGTHLDPSNVSKKLKAVFLELGINSDEKEYSKSFHDLRHTYATRQFEMRVEPLVISKLLGHSDINTTLRTYIHVLNSLKDATAGLTDAFYTEMTLANTTDNIVRIYGVSS